MDDEEPLIDEKEIEEMANSQLRRYFSGLNPYMYFEFGRSLGRLKSFSVLILAGHGKIRYSDIKDIIDGIVDNLSRIEKICPEGLARQIRVLIRRIEGIFSEMKSDEILGESHALYLNEVSETLGEQISEDMKEINEKYIGIGGSSIEEDIQKDIFEAFNDYLNRCYKSAIVMCRRVIQNELMKKGISSKRKNGSPKSIKEMIEEAEKNGIIDEKLSHDLTSIRKLAAWSAHPQDEGLDNITKEDARKSLNATIKFLAELYNDKKLKKVVID